MEDKKQDEGKRRRFVADARVVLTFLIVILTFAFAFTTLLLGVQTETYIPVWMGSLITGVLNLYFMGRMGEVMRGMTQEMEKWRKDRDEHGKSAERPNST